MTVHLVTDSTSDLLPAQAADLRVTVVPLTVRFGDVELRDGVDIDAAQFYERLRSSKHNPTTSQPTPADFGAVYSRLLEAPGDQVVSIHVSQKWSGTVQSASIAAREWGGRVVTVDSGSVSAGIQFLVRGARLDLDRGCDLQEVVANCEARRGRARLWVLMASLTYLHRGGRIGRARAMVGGVLSIKPVLQLIDGEVHDRWKVRASRQGMEKMLAAAAAEGRVDQVAMMCSHDHPLASETASRLREMYPGLELITGELGPVVGTYNGPDSLGVGLLRSE